MGIHKLLEKKSDGYEKPHATAYGKIYGKVWKGREFRLVTDPFAPVPYTPLNPIIHRCFRQPE